MDGFLFPHFPAPKSLAQFALFRKVENAAQLRKRIIGAAALAGAKGEEERDAVNFAFIDAKLITSRLHLQTAIHQAILAFTQDSLRTKYVHSEILFYLNPTNNITEALRRYGISDTSTDMIVVRVGDASLPPSNAQELMKDVVIGTIVPFSELEQVTDWGAVKKYHKLNSEAAVRDLKGEEERIAIDRIVTSTVAMKSVMQ
ncbi:CGI-121-domain-containing protein [Coprinopsis marcescibilis]|uniref:EKC/KEOPS complex subunit CGI121 n=1 Tax=Coprinopsis marcescibilis TaxID=230819 RepID=A0A5C3L6F9_COPMA|nr:CGI-121-domain-containing protein [Coprinopsis marcescibilis]